MLNPSQQHRSNRLSPQGFTLLEVLISIVVLSLGLLGLAGLQAVGIRNSNSAHYQSVAAQYAAEMGDRMRANPTFDYTTITSHSPQASCKTTAGCTPMQMATNDIDEWLAGIAASLPLGSGTITGTTPVFTVSVKWDDERSGVAGGPSGTFTVEVRP